MELHLVHALVLTPFESSLVPLEWEEVAACDFAIHALYCENSGRLLFHSDNQKFDCAKEISKIQHLLKLSGINLSLSKQIIILRDDENEYCEQDVLKHFQ